MPVEVIVKLVEVVHDICQTSIILAIILPMLITGFKCLHLLLKSYLEDKSDDYKRNYRS